MSSVRITILFVMPALFAGGCIEPRQKKIDAPAPLCFANLDTPEAIRISEKALYEMHFRIAKSDPMVGYLLTEPLEGAHNFEFWRKDNVGVYNRAEANLHSLRRTIELKYDLSGDNLCLTCTSRVERLSMPVKTTGTFQSQTIELKSARESERDWIDLGPDHALEQYLIKKIDKKIKSYISKRDKSNS